MSETQTVKSGATPLLAPAPPQMRQFAFMIGIWDVRLTSYKPDGGIDFECDGVWRAEYRNDGRMLLDEFTRLSDDRQEVSYSATLRTFCPETNQWEMTFLFSQQRQIVQSFEGAFIDGEGHFNAVAEVAPGKTVVAKVLFTDIEQNSFQWRMESSLDQGKTWVLGQTMTARRIL